MPPPQELDDGSDSSSISDPRDPREDDGWEDVEPDEESVSILSLFDERTFPDARSMLSYCREHHGFDIWKLRQDFDLDFLGLIKLVNYVRSEVQAGYPQPDVSSRSKFDDDQYLKPVLDNDALLYSLDDVFDEAASAGPSGEVEQLREQLTNLQSHFTAYREEVQKAMLERLDSPEVSTESRDAPESQSHQNLPDKNVGGSFDHAYFKSYSYNGIHESMIKDRIRTDAYRDFIYDHKDLFKDKVVLDVGCGTGILSMFCAKAGAKLVIAVDNSDIIDKAREIVFQNGLQSTVKCLRGKIEEVTLPVAQVDVIVSEWMGYCLLYESMLDSVLYARDKYLAPDGLMVPSHAMLRIAPLSDSDLKASHIDFWRDVYGFDMAAMLERAHEDAVVRVVEEKELAADSCAFLELDLHTTQVKDLTFRKPFTAKWKEGFRTLEGFVVWFDIIFAKSRTEHGVKPGMTAAEAKQKTLVAFSTGPYSEATHWQQGILLIKDPKDEFHAGEELYGEVTYVRKQGQERSLDIGVSWSKGPGSGKEEVKRQIWVLD